MQKEDLIKPLELFIKETTQALNYLAPHAQTGLEKIQPLIKMLTQDGKPLPENFILALGLDKNNIPDEWDQDSFVRFVYQLKGAKGIIDYASIAERAKDYNPSHTKFVENQTDLIKNAAEEERYEDAAHIRELLEWRETFIDYPNSHLFFNKKAKEKLAPLKEHPCLKTPIPLTCIFVDPRS